MENKHLLLLCILVLSASLIEGYRTQQGQRCLCKKTVKKPKLKNIEEITLYPTSALCDRIEVTAVLKNKSTICINPDIKPIKQIISGKKSKKMKGIKVTNYITKKA